MTTDLPADQAAGSALPNGLRLLYTSATEPNWATLTSLLEGAGCRGPQYRWVSKAGEAMSLLRQESFDCVILGPLDQDGSTTAPDNLQLLEALQASGCDDPIVLAMPEVTDALWMRACVLGAELFESTSPWSSPALVPLIQRAIGRAETVREQYRLSLVEQRREHRDRDEAHLLLDHLNQILASNPDPPTGAEIPPGILEDYRELLRTYVIMGTGNLGGDIALLAGRLSEIDASPRDALAVHVQSLETLIAGLGNRSTRHIMARGDLMALELVVQLGDCDRRRRAA